ncbi:MAG: hypothetical protein A2Z37_00725 [Chloroflexi bacterium RBG_19FT_COMBO_62_14]|nr:MAG: hypothetical protein A2Z37_00725 [Chloroflexi bacterium RBG_19FT_COMBO_62_14]
MKEWRVRPALVMLFLILALAVPSPVFGEGPGTGGRQIRLEDEPAGPYLLRVVSSPTPPRVESLYLEVRVTEAASGREVTDASVWTRADYEDGQAPSIEVEAVHAIAPIPTEYASHLPVSRSGTWSITITVDGPQGQGEASLLIQILEPTSISAFISVGLPVAGLAALAVIFYLLQRRYALTSD